MNAVEQGAFLRVRQGGGKVKVRAWADECKRTGLPYAVIYDGPKYSHVDVDLIWTDQLFTNAAVTELKELMWGRLMPRHPQPHKLELRSGKLLIAAFGVPHEWAEELIQAILALPTENER